MRTIDIIMAKRFGKGKKGMAIGWPLMLGIAGGKGASNLVGSAIVGTAKAG